MQAKKIIGLITGEIDFTEDTLYGLKYVVEEYPYFQLAQLLYTINLQTTRDSRFNAQLRKTACHLNDRQNLFYRIRSDSFPSEWIEKLERKGEEETENTSFDLIDSFLAEQERKDKEDKVDKEDKKSLSMTVVQERISTDYFSMLSDLPDDAQTEPIPLQHQNIIDIFLEKDKISPVKIGLKDQPEEESDLPFDDLETVEENSFFSETLAKIYLKQKKYEKALEIIRKLYLLYPEKNRYFADQIRFLEKLVNNTNK